MKHSLIEQMTDDDLGPEDFRNDEIYRVKNSDTNMVAVINGRTDGKYAVALIDADSGEVAGLRIFPTSMLENAKAYADGLL